MTKINEPIFLSPNPTPLSKEWRKNAWENVAKRINECKEYLLNLFRKSPNILMETELTETKEPQIIRTEFDRRSRDIEYMHNTGIYTSGDPLEDMKEKAREDIKKDGTSIHRIPEILKYDWDFNLELVSIKPCVIIGLPKELKDNKKFQIEAVKLNPDVANLPDFVEKNPGIAKLPIFNKNKKIGLRGLKQDLSVYKALDTMLAEDEDIIAAYNKRASELGRKTIVTKNSLFSKKSLLEEVKEEQPVINKFLSKEKSLAKEVEEEAPVIEENFLFKEQSLLKEIKEEKPAINEFLSKERPLARGVEE